MKIAFWGGSPRCGTTSSMTATAAYLAVHTGNRSICVQPKEGGSDLEQFFRPWNGRAMLHEESTYYALEGMDYLIWQEQHHRLNEATIRETLIPVFAGQLSYLPSGAREKPGLYPAQTGQLQRRILTQLEQCAELIFIDVGAAKDGLAGSLLELADVVVVNFSGEQQELETFFAQPIATRGKTMYLLSDYADDQVYNRENLQRIYRVESRNIWTLPTNLQFAHACVHGRVDQFIRTYHSVRGGHKHAAFFEQLRQFSSRILEVGSV